jgi:lipopolysaccharide/colanic/teichoic acid biosynthesis glycosyltransferase
VGKDGRLFPMWKFRTMRVDAERESGPVWARAGDARRTLVGRFLRRTSLDELPQLWNVLLGHMSIVGPRPERPMFVARFSDGNPWYRFRHRIRPGITGLAQVRGLRGDTPLEPRVESDNWYIEHWSLWLDLRIAAHTLLEVVRGRNAH